MTDPKRDYRSIPALWREYEVMPRRMRFHARSIEEWRAWREALVPVVWRLLGRRPASPVSLDPEILESSDEGTFRLEKVSIQCEPGVYMPSYVLVPTNVDPPYRPILALHGHGIGGAAYLIGRHVTDDTAAETEMIRALNYDYARQLAERGYLVIVPEQRGFGERMERGVATVDYVDDNPLWAGTCRALQFNALLIGKTAIGLRVWDAMRAIDYLRSRPEAQTDRLGCVGLSGGGATALFLAALDERVWATVVSGYLNTFRASLMRYIACECNYIPRILEYAEMSDLAALIAPRPLLIESGISDDLLPVEATERAFGTVRGAYALLGVAERIEKDIFPGGHAFSGQRAFPFFERWLRPDG